jgi:hypothetical protein
MVQKYKVFVDNKNILFVQNEQSNVKIIDPAFFPLEYNTLNAFLNSLNAIEFQVISNDPLDSLTQFFTHFKFIVAAGGLVKKKETYLFIFRNGYWDLPKGKVEKSESIMDAAQREIMEECGLFKPPKIVRELPSSYHVYSMKGKSYFKKTHWFEMSYDGAETLHPQIEEGISEVVWLTQIEYQSKLKVSYDSIRALICDYESL